MKKILILPCLMLFSAFSYAQPCKSVKVGMAKLSVDATIGKPDRTESITDARTSSAMEVWTYGNQQVIFNGDVVERIVADVKRENDLTVSVNEGKLTRRDYQLIMEKVNSEGCK